MSLTTNRIALSTIKDSHLNSSPSNTPSKDKKRPALYNSNKPKSKLFSPSHLRIRQPDLITKSFSIAHSATSLNKSFLRYVLSVFLIIDRPYQINHCRHRHRRRLLQI